MIKNYFKIAWRNLRKNSLQTIINLLGLTIGTVCCLSILVYVIEQTGYDSHYQDASSIYRIRTLIDNGGNGKPNFNSATSSPPIAFTLKQDFPEVLEACRMVYFGEGNDELIRIHGKNEGFYEPNGYLADSTFFSIFNYPFMEGRATDALNKPNTIVLSSSLAKKLFGNQKALNKTLIKGSGEEELTLTVTGVFNANFGKSHLNPNYILSMNSAGLGANVRSIQNFATENFVHSYVKLSPGSSADNLEKKLPEFLQKHGAEDFAAVGFTKTLLLQNIAKIHLYSKGIANQIGKVSDIQYLYLLLILGFFIQLVACINFINLSTARANKRAKEIGVRKVVGASIGSLVKQFLGESVILSLFAAVLSIPLTALLLPFVNQLTMGNVAYYDLFQPNIIIAILGLGVITGILAGAYPALVLSSIKPIKVLKGSVNLKLGSGNFRKALVVFQFVVSIGLISTIIIVTQQIKYAQNKDMGFNKEHLVAIRLGTEEAEKSFNTLKTKFKTVAGVSEVTGCDKYPSQYILGDVGLHLPGEHSSKQTLVKYNGVSKDYFKTVGSKLLVGRDVRPEDSLGIIVNKATIDAFNIKLDKAIGSIFKNTYYGQTDELEIIGVVEDFHFASLKEAIAPLLLYYQDEPEWIILKTETDNYKSLFAELNTTWKSTVSNTPFVYSFIDKEVEKFFAEEKRLANISIAFTCLAVIISCLGLFGLIAFVAEQKRKEIGIRKVLGADVRTVVQMLTKDLVILVFIASLIAIPLAYYFMEKWLQDFTYRIEIHWWVFALAGGITMTITLLTISIQSIKAAMANPIKSLRTE